MLFNSMSFILFYILVTVCYFLSPFRWRWFILLAASCYFYMAFVPVYILILGGTIVVDYFAGRLIERSQGAKRKLLLIISLVANIGVLAFFKYFNFLNDILSDILQNFQASNPIPFLSIILPIGLSFHTFQAMAYTIEVYRGNQPAEKHFGIYSLYVMFYPQLVAGPIERPQNIIYQMHQNHKFSMDRMVSGLGLMLWGFFKKLVVADRLAMYTDSVFYFPKLHNGTTVVIAAVFFAIQIYCDFSGYSDIAIGSARTMGFDLMTNFRRPYFATSIKEFWSRWHISLSTWFRDYLYIPLGGSRHGKFAHYRNLLIVFLISGLWHGANFTFLIWGALHGIYLITEHTLHPFRRFLKDSWSWGGIIVKVTGTVLTLILVVFSWIFFRAASLQDALTMIGNLHTFGQMPATEGVNVITHAVLAIMLLLIVESKMEFFPGRFATFSNENRVIRWVAYLSLAMIILMFGVLNGGQFIYFQF